jgi:hypothetical protein
VRNEARSKGEDPRKVMPVQPQPEHLMTVRVDLDRPEALRDWFATG